MKFLVLEKGLLDYQTRHKKRYFNDPNYESIYGSPLYLVWDVLSRFYSLPLKDLVNEKERVAATEGIMITLEDNNKVVLHDPDFGGEFKMDFSNLEWVKEEYERISTSWPEEIFLYREGDKVFITESVGCWTVLEESN